MKAYILAGGLGSRLFPFTFAVPKPLLMLGQKTVIEHILDRLSDANFEEFVIALSSRGWMYRASIGDNYRGIKVRYMESNAPLGTAGQLKHVAAREKEPFFVSYSDSIIDANFRDAITKHLKSHPLATIFVLGLESKIPYGQIVLAKGNVEEWREKPSVAITVAVGAFIFDPKFLSYIPAGQRYGMNVAVNNALKGGEKIVAYDAKNFIDVGSKKKYLEAVKKEVESLGEIP
ncbi:MAG: nucleotidyltransferase family protein [Nitrososphaerota archaeon]|jgi:mannose-1-phosphate guanylyltransferase|nr:nucleotidyltransferase family protein [Nitrososphaerota archaeon]MDG6932997.1 nucleotidyltransferase family protein [Nitrososphaerota archaeon]MDG6936187.1 nucleotidyltransferase family protein [Nitrososphaerota archaeon]MDG6944676.1 nucleotidyltransferase family protein [Nitrososphaerota archaeon]